MRVLSVKQPFAQAIVLGRKRVENRRWITSYRGLIAIHASLKLNPEFYKSREYEHTRDKRMYRREILEHGAIIGVCNLVDIVTDSKMPWARAREFHWVLANARILAHPIKFRGGLGLRELDSRIVARIRRIL